MDGSSLLTNLWRPQESKWLWPMVSIASVLVHGLILVVLRSLTVEVVDQQMLATETLPVQLVTLPLETEPASAPVAENPPRPERSVSSQSPPIQPPLARPTTPRIPIAAPSPQPSQPQPQTIREDPAAMSPPGSASAPVNPPPSTVPSPQPVPEPAPTVGPGSSAPGPAIGSPSPTEPLPSVPPTPQPTFPPSIAEVPGPVPEPGSQPGTGEIPTPEDRGGQSQGGQLTAQIRPHPRGRDIPEVAPQVQGNNRIAMQPLPLGCTAENFSALVATMNASTVQLQILVEADGRISAASVVPGQGSGNAAMDALVSCLVRDRLSLVPAYSGGTPIKTDAFILEAQISF